MATLTRSRFTADAALSLRLHEFTLSLYYTEQAVMGIVPPTPFASLAAIEQARYRTRAEIAVLSGIGHLHGRALNAAARYVAHQHDVWQDYTERGAADIEDMLSEMPDAYETALLEAWRTRR